MPHDSKGRLIEPGDVVKGKGYNIKHEIIGRVLAVFPSSSCNLQVAVANVIDYPSGCGMLHTVDGKTVMIAPGVEYGQCDAFELIMKKDGSEPTD